MAVAGALEEHHTPLLDLGAIMLEKSQGSYRRRAGEKTLLLRKCILIRMAKYKNSVSSIKRTPAKSPLVKAAIPSLNYVKDGLVIK